MIVLDTSILSLAFRRRASVARAGKAEEVPEVLELRRLIAEDVDVCIPGIVFQEILSGVRTIDQFSKLKDSLAGFSILLAGDAHHAAAADIANRCRWSGVAASTIDCLIASTTLASDASLFTLDGDFEAMAPICGLRLHRLDGDSA